jgi:alkylation response protein AidB-like acyl-CoA dehydrogenase
MNFELTEEQLMLRNMARNFAEQEMLPTLKDRERQGTMDYDLIKKMGSLGLLGAPLPQEYGGGGLDYTSAAIIWEQLSWASWTQTLSALGHNIVTGSILDRVASQEQKQKYLPAMCQGELVMAISVVEPNAGSDATAVETTAELDGDQWVINGTKNFITGGGIADMALTLVQTDKSQGYRGLALIAINKDTPGFSSTNVKMVGNWAGNMANLSFSDCRVPKENLVGEIGKGLRNSLIGIEVARLLVAAGGIGMAQSCLDACIKYAKERHQFGKPIASFQLVQEIVARMAAEIEALRLLVYYAGELKSKGRPHAKEMSSAKWLATELALKVSTEAIRLHGAYGCTDDFPVEHHYRDAVLASILAGTIEMHKLIIGRELLGVSAVV